MSERNLPIPLELERLSAFIDSRIECLVEPSSELRGIALCATKHIFDWALETEKSSKPHLKTLLATLTEAVPPQTRSQVRNSPPQRADRSLSPTRKTQKKIDLQETPLPTLFIEGMNADQIWQQLDLRAARVCDNLQTLQGEDDETADSDGDGDGGLDEDEDMDGVADVDMNDDEGPWNGLSDEEEDASSMAEGVVGLRSEESSEDDGGDEPPISMFDVVRNQQKPNPTEPYQGCSDLDDGFFDLITFNAETYEMEAREVSKRSPKSVRDDDSSEGSEVDFFGPVDDLETGAVGDGPVPTELFYKDFFEPPPRMQNKPSKVRFHEQVSVKKIKAVGKGMPISFVGDEDSDDEEGSDFGDDGD